MTLERLKGEIIAAAKAKARQSVEDARKEAKGILSKAEKDFQPVQERIEAETKTMKDAIMTREKSAANLEAKKLAFEEKKRLIDEVFSSAHKELVSLKDSDRAKLIARYLERASKEISIGKVYVAPRDAKLVKGYPTEALDLAGGLIAESEDSLTRVDYSLDTMIADFREKELHNVVSIILK